MIKKKDNEEWGGVASWYDDLLEAGASYQKDVILPDLLAVVAPKGGDRILDLACGQGFFSRAFRDAGAEVIGVDVAHELIDIAKNYEKEDAGAEAEPSRSRSGGGLASDSASAPAIKYFVASSDQLDFLAEESFDKIAIILALQNISKVAETLAECRRILKPGGSLCIVLNHPCFRIPKESGWGFDDKNSIQYRKVNKYMSEFKVAINMHPGESQASFTSSLHRPLQFYFKQLKSAGLLVKTLHELVSNKISLPGKRSAAENQARKEFPLFMLVEAVKAGS